MEKPANKKRKHAAENGVVTPQEIAILVDRYLSDNNFSRAQSTFRTEASNVFSRFSVPEASNTLMSLSSIFVDYIRLKEQKHLVEQEIVHLDQEKARVNTFLQGMHNLMRSFNSLSTAVHPTDMNKMVVNSKPMASGIPFDHSPTGRGTRLLSSKRRACSTQQNVESSGPPTKKYRATEKEASGSYKVPGGTVVRRTGISKRVTPPTPPDIAPASAPAPAPTPDDDAVGAGCIPPHSISHNDSDTPDGGFSGSDFDLDFLNIENLGDDFFVLELLNEIDPCYKPFPCDDDLVVSPEGDLCSKPAENDEAENIIRISEDDKTGESCLGFGLGFGLGCGLGPEGSSPTI